MKTKIKFHKQWFGLLPRTYITDINKRVYWLFFEFISKQGEGQMSFYTKNKEGVLTEVPIEKVETLLNNDVKIYSDKDLISELSLKVELS